MACCLLIAVSPTQAQDAVPAAAGPAMSEGPGYRLPKSRDPEPQSAPGLSVFRNNRIPGGIGLVPGATEPPVWLGYAGGMRGVASGLTLNTTLSAGMFGGNDGVNADFQRAHLGITENYTIFRGGVDFRQAFRNDWQGRIALSGQYADALAPWQHGVGGSGAGGIESVRGYQLREFADDKGYVSQLELYTPDFATSLGMGDKWRSRVVGFYDFGEVWRNNGLPGDRSSAMLASTGLGLRLAYGRSISLHFDLAQPLRAYNARQFDSQRLNAGVLISY